MKNIIILVLMMVLFVFGTNVLASPQYQDRYKEVGIDMLVVELLKDGVQVNVIVPECLEIEGLNPQNLIKALYCAGAKGQDIRDAAEKNGLTELIIVAGYKKSVDECRDRVEDSQAYTPTSSGPTFSSPSGGRGGAYASPSTF